MITNQQRCEKWERHRLHLLVALLLLFALVQLNNHLNSSLTTMKIHVNGPFIKIQSNEVSPSKMDSIHFRTESYVFYKHRLRLWYEGRCIDATDRGELVATFCDPDKEQSFSLTIDNRLVYERLGKCVEHISNGTDSRLLLVECSEVSGVFTLSDNDGVFLQRVVNDKELCVTPVSPLTGGNVTQIPCLDDPLRLTLCNKVASRLVLMEENFFQLDRKLLKQINLPPGRSSDFKSCGFNKREPIKPLPQDQVTKCTKLWECVTLVVKTSRRPHLILRQAKQMKLILGFDLPTIVYDDGPDDYSAETMRQIAEFPLMKYIISSDEDLGIARGRNLALLQVKTKYFFLLDDDVTFTERTKIAKLVEILDTTDATVASAGYGNTAGFAALMELGYFHQIEQKRRIGVFNGACEMMNQTTPNFPSCFRCDMTSNTFWARTQDVIKIGGWDPELMIIEHKDIFIRLKAARMKLVYCEDVKLFHSRPRKGKPAQGEGYLEKRRRSGNRFRLLLYSRWNIHNIFQRGTENVRIEDNGELTYPDQKEHGRC